MAKKKFHRKKIIPLVKETKNLNKILPDNAVILGITTDGEVSVTSSVHETRASGAGVITDVVLRCTVDKSSDGEAVFTTTYGNVCWGEPKHNAAYLPSEIINNKHVGLHGIIKEAWNSTYDFELSGTALVYFKESFDSEGAVFSAEYDDIDELLKNIRGKPSCVITPAVANTLPDTPVLRLSDGDVTVKHSVLDTGSATTYDSSCVYEIGNILSRFRGSKFSDTVYFIYYTDIIFCKSEIGTTTGDTCPSAYPSAPCFVYPEGVKIRGGVNVRDALKSYTLNFDEDAVSIIEFDTRVKSKAYSINYDLSTIEFDNSTLNPVSYVREYDAGRDSSVYITEAMNVIERISMGEEYSASIVNDLRVMIGDRSFGFYDDDDKGKLRQFTRFLSSLRSIGSVHKTRINHIAPTASDIHNEVGSFISNLDVTVDSSKSPALFNRSVYATVFKKSTSEPTPPTSTPCDLQGMIGILNRKKDISDYIKITMGGAWQKSTNAMMTMEDLLLLLSHNKYVVLPSGDYGSCTTVDSTVVHEGAYDEFNTIRVRYDSGTDVHDYYVSVEEILAESQAVIADMDKTKHAQIKKMQETLATSSMLLEKARVTLVEITGVDNIEDV